MLIIQFHNKDYNFDLLQYTGLKAKGKEIYISDILQWGDSILEVKNDYKLLADLSSPSVVNLEIIGNIFENKELLDG